MLISGDAIVGVLPHLTVGVDATTTSHLLIAGFAAVGALFILRSDGCTRRAPSHLLMSGETTFILRSDGCTRCVLAVTLVVGVAALGRRLRRSR